MDTNMIDNLAVVSQHGLLTPEPSLGPDEARNKSDSNRIQLEVARQGESSSSGSGSTQTGQRTVAEQTRGDGGSSLASANEQGTVTQAQSTNGTQPQAVDRNESGARSVEWTKQQEDEIKRILAAPANLHHEVFGLPSGITMSPAKIKTKYRKLSGLVHPDKCKHPDATTAMAKVNTASRALGFNYELNPGEEFAENAYESDETQEDDASEWPWTTALTADKQRMLGYMPRGRGNRVIVEHNPGSPVFTIQSASECGMVEFQKYLRHDDILNLGGPSRRKWGFKHRGLFQRLRYIAISEYNTQNQNSATGRRDPESWCFVDFEGENMQALTTSEFRCVVGRKSADAAIEKICEDSGEETPMEKRPVNITQKREDFERREKQTGPTIKREDSETGDSAHPRDAILLKVLDRLEALEKTSQATTVALNSLLEKIGGLTLRT